MATRTDTARQPFSAVLLFLLGALALFCLRAVVAPHPAEGSLPGDVLLGAALTRWLAAVPGLSEVAGVALAFFCAIRITRIATRNMLYVTRTFLSIPFYAVAAAGLYMTPGNVNGMLCSLLFILASNLLISSFRRGTGFDLVFQAGVLLGAMPLVLPVSAVLWTAVPVGMAVFRRSGREAVVCVVGLLLPLALWSYVGWLCGGAFTGPALDIWGYLATPDGFEPLGLGAGRLVLCSLLTLVVFLSVGSIAATTMRTRPSRIFRYFVCMAVAALAGFLLPCRSVTLYPLIAPAVAILAPFFFVRHPGRLPALIYWGTMLWAVGLNIAQLV